MGKEKRIIIRQADDRILVLNQTEFVQMCGVPKSTFENSVKYLLRLLEKHPV